MQTRHGVFSRVRRGAHRHRVSKHGPEQHVLHGRYVVLRAQHRRGHLQRGDLHPVLDLDSAFDVSHGLRLHFLVLGGVSAGAVFRFDRAHDAHINEYDPERAGQADAAD